MSVAHMTCEEVEELAAAWALHAVEPAEDGAMREHVATCAEAHAGVREALDGVAAIDAAVEPVEPGPELRARILASAAAGRTATAAPSRGRPWWQPSWNVPAAAAAGALALAIGLGTWAASLRAELAERDAQVAMLASADAAHRATGPAGSGWLVVRDDEAVFMTDDLAPLASGTLYEFWVIDDDGAAQAAGTLTETDGVQMVALERPVGNAVTFAVTVEDEPVAASQNEPVLLAALES